MCRLVILLVRSKTEMTCFQFLYFYFFKKKMLLSSLTHLGTYSSIDCVKLFISSSFILLNELTKFEQENLSLKQNKKYVKR